TCHRIEAEVLKIRNPEKFEDQIVWHPLRKLTISNFRGPIDKRPFLAATSSTFRYAMKMNNFTGRALISVESYFDCKLSYFKPSTQDSAVLAHEQLHFDITEIYARKFRKKVKEIYVNPKQFAGIHEAVYAEIFNEMVLKQDEYD